MFLLLFVFAVHLSTCHVIDVEYRDKVVSDHKGDGFGVSLATSHHKLVIGAPWGGGSVMVDEGVRVKGPEGSFRFGSDVDVNQYFMVVSGYDNPSFVYVYQSYSPYNMVARIPINGEVYSIVISDDNTIAVSHGYYDHDYLLTIYHYDGSCAWNIAQKLKLEGWGLSLAVYGDIIVVGVPWASHFQGLVRIINRVDGVWVQGQTIKQDGVDRFGSSVAIHGQHIVVSSH